MRFDADQERNTGRAIRMAEMKTREVLAGIDSAEAILRARPKREERTRAGAIDRLEQAVLSVRSEARRTREPELVELANQASRHWDEAESLRWQLAMSARRIARGEARKLTCSLMAEEDLVQEGYIGLLRAARRYDPDRGIRFTTYARWWVRAQMTRALETAGRMVRLPGGAVEQLRNLQRIMERMDLAGVAYSLEDVAAEIGIDKSRAELLLSHRGIVSIDQPDDDGLKVGDRLPTSGERVDPHDNASLIQEITQMHDALDRVLDERERYILTEHFGLNGRNARTMADIGKTMGLSRERVRQIECAALRRLRNNI
ncbi:MAG: sigma-70 family RNA polymerase sigma factor [Myxococcota bacterium]